MAPAHGKLVVRIKTLQRVWEKRVAWEEYCAEHLKNVCDPKRHNAKILVAYLESIQVEVSEDDGDGDDIDDDDPFQHESMVSRVKEFQSWGRECREAWEKFCDQKMGGVKDPARHFASSLLRFLKLHENGPAAGGHKKSAKSEKKAKKEEKSQHVEFVRCGQRCSPSFKKAWKAYCKLHHDGDTDPTELDADDLTYFADYVGQALQSAMAADADAVEGAAPDGEEAAGRKRPAADGDEGSAPKASRTGESEAPAPPEKKKVTMKKSVAEEIKRINAAGSFSSQIRLAGVAEPLGRLDEETALAVLRAVEAAEDVTDPTATIVASVAATLQEGGEEEAES